MANPQQLQFLQDSTDDWNMHRREQQWTHPGLSGADLSAAELPNADLSGANLVGADLKAIDLSGSNLSHADLRGANLSDAGLLKPI